MILSTKLCCSVNQHCYCSLCGHRWCLLHWKAEKKTHKRDYVFTTCPAAEVTVKWSTSKKYPLILVANEI